MTTSKPMGDKKLVVWIIVFGSVVILTIAARVFQVFTAPSETQKREELDALRADRKEGMEMQISLDKEKADRELAKEADTLFENVQRIKLIKTQAHALILHDAITEAKAKRGVWPKSFGSLDWPAYSFAVDGFGQSFILDDQGTVQSSGPDRVLNNDDDVFLYADGSGTFSKEEVRTQANSLIAKAKASRGE